MPPNTEGENGAAGPQHIPHYGQQPLQQQQEQLGQYPQQSSQHQPQYIPGINNNYGVGTGTMMNTNNNNNNHNMNMNMNTNGDRRRTEEEDHLNVNATRGIQPTPLFERLVTEEVQELKAYARIIESQNRRLAELERVHGDLETRLEVESRTRQQLEGTLEERERQWNEKYATLEKDRDHWKEVVQMEETKNSRLIEQVVRKDQDIQKMLQRKYDHPRGDFSQTTRNYRAGGNNSNERERSSTPNSTSRSPSTEYHKSPHEILVSNGTTEDVRARNVAHTLMDFFNMK